MSRSAPSCDIEHFPSYAPEINPDERVWSLAKRQLANGRPDDLLDLLADVAQTLEGIAMSFQKLRGCIEQSDLPPFSCADYCILYAVVNNTARGETR
jgi:hypothetical protein